MKAFASIFFFYSLVTSLTEIDTGRYFMDIGNETTIDSLDRIPASSPYYSVAQQRLAELFLTQNTVAARRKAKEHIQKALLAQPHNLEFQLTHIHILYEQGFYRSANEYCDRLLAVPIPPKQSYNTQYAEAYYYKGLIAERFAFKYKDMISVIGEDNFISLAHYGEEDLKFSAHCYEKALEFHSAHRDALFHLGLLYYEIRSFEKMAMLFEKIVSQNPQDKDAYAFAALAYYNSGQYEKSKDYYQMAMNFMSEQELAEFNHIGYIVAPPDQKKYQNGGTAPSEAAEFQRSFWNQKDPLYLTAYNERLLEHYNRMTYVNLRFGVPRMNITGWKTDRGMIYIRYGKPVLLYKTQPDEKKLGGGETWVYTAFSFTFDDEYASGNFLMDQSNYLAARSAYHAHEDIYSLPLERTFEMQSRLYQFKGANGSTRARAYFQAYIKSMEPEFDVMAMDAEAECGLFFLDGQANIVHESRKHLKLGSKDTTEQKFVSFIELDRLPTQAGARRYSFEIMTVGDKRTAVSRDSTAIMDFSGDRLMLSDVIMASSIAEHPELKIIPNFTGVFSKTENLFLYFEVYNLLLNDDARGQFKVNARLQQRGNGGLSGVLRNLLKDKNGGQIGSSFDVTSYSRDERFFFGLNLTDVTPGNYDLHLQITDTMANASVERVLPITIKP